MQERLGSGVFVRWQLLRGEVVDNFLVTQYVVNESGEVLASTLGEVVTVLSGTDRDDFAFHTFKPTVCLE